MFSFEPHCQGLCGSQKYGVDKTSKNINLALTLRARIRALDVLRPTVESVGAVSK